MASPLNTKTAMLTFLRDFLEITENENVAQIKVFEKLKDSYEVISKYEIELACLLCEQGLDPPPLSSLFLQNNLEANEIIAGNLVYLTECTGNWPDLKVHLRAKNLLSGSEIQILDSILDDKSRFYKMYEWIKKIPGCINDVINCLDNSNNAHIAAAIREAQLVWIKNKTTLNKAFWNQMEKNVAEFENNSTLVQHETASRRIYNEKSEVSLKIINLEAEKQLLKRQIDELLKKLMAARQSETEIRTRLEVAVEIEKPQLIEELNRLQRNIQDLNTEKAKLKSELRKCQTIIHNQSAKLEDLKKKYNEVLGQLVLAENNKFELEQQILKTISDYELERKSNYDILESVKLENMAQLRDLKKQLDVFEADNMEVNEEVLTLHLSIKKLTRQSLSNRENLIGVNKNGNQESIESGNVKVVPQNTADVENAEDINQDNDTIVEPKPSREVERTLPVLDLAESAATEDFVFTGESNIVFQLPESGFDHKVSVTIESCRIDVVALKKSLKRCTKLRSLKLLNVEMMNIHAIFDITMDLPSLETLTMFIENPLPYVPSWDTYDRIFYEINDSDYPSLTYSVVPKSDIHFVHNGQMILYSNKQKGEFVFNRLVDSPTSNFVSSKLKLLNNIKSLALYECSFNIYPILLNLTELVIFNCTFSNLKQLLGKTLALRRFKYIDNGWSANRTIKIHWLPICLEELSIDSPINLTFSAVSLFRKTPAFSNLHSLYLSCASIDNNFYITFLKSFPAITHLQLNFRNDTALLPRFENILKSLTLNWIRLAEINVRIFKEYCKAETDIKHLQYVMQRSKNDNPITLELVRSNGNDSKWECAHCDPECLEFGGSGKSFEMMGLDKFYSSPSRVPRRLYDKVGYSKK